MDQPPIIFIVETSKILNPERVKPISGFQLSKFFKDYSQIIPDRDISILFTGNCPELFLDEIEHILYSKGSKVKVLIKTNLTYKLDSRSISSLKRFSSIIIPFHNKYSGNDMEILISNLSSLPDKEKCVIFLNGSDKLTDDKYSALIRVAKKLGFSKISSDFNFSEELERQCSLADMEFLELSFLSNYNFFIEYDGTVRNPKNTNFISSIYKPVAYMFFSN